MIDGSGADNFQEIEQLCTQALVKKKDEAHDHILRGEALFK